MDPNQVTQVFQRCPSCRAVVSPADATCPTCGRSLADAVERTMAMPRVEAEPEPIASPDVTMQLPTAPPRPRPYVAPAPGSGPRVTYAVRPQPARRRGFPVGLLLAALLIGVAILVYLAATQAASTGAGLPSFARPATNVPSGPPPANQAPPANGWVVANTGGEGVFLRRTPKLDDKVVAWPDGTPMQDQGETAIGDGTTWRKVRDPAGNVGYVPTQWLAPKA